MIIIKIFNKKDYFFFSWAERVLHEQHVPCFQVICILTAPERGDVGNQIRSLIKDIKQ